MQLHRAHEPTKVPEVATGVHRCGRPVEAVVSENEELARGAVRGRGRRGYVEREGHVAARRVLACLRSGLGLGWADGQLGLRSGWVWVVGVEVKLGSGGWGVEVGLGLGG